MEGSFWWRRLLRKLNAYKGISQVMAGSGETILFWKDLWNGQLLQNQFPHLFSFSTNKGITLQSVLNQETLQDIFQLLLSKEAFSEFCDLENLLMTVQLNENGDQWSYIWGK
jgi:hypothetical protein